MTERETVRVVAFDELPHGDEAHRFEGGQHGGVEISVVLVHTAPGSEPMPLHRHPYPEVFIVETGEATFRVGDQALVVGEGHVVVAPADVPHQYVNSGQGELRVVAIHPSSTFQTESVSDKAAGSTGFAPG